MSDAAANLVPGDIVSSFGLDDASLGIVAMLVGFFMTFFGRKFLKLLIVSVGFFGAASCGAVLSPMFLDRLVLFMDFPQEHYMTAVWGTALVVGLIGGVLAWYMWKIGLYLAGGLGGFIVSSWLLLVLPRGSVEAYMSRNAFLLIFAILGAFITILVEDYILMTSSVIAGSTILMYGLDKFCRIGFAEAVAELVNSDYMTLDSMSGNAKIMLASTVALACVGLFVQCTCTHKPSSPSKSRCSSTANNNC